MVRPSRLLRVLIGGSSVALTLLIGVPVVWEADVSYQDRAVVTKEAETDPPAAVLSSAGELADPSDLDGGFSPLMDQQDCCLCYIDLNMGDTPFERERWLPAMRNRCEDFFEGSPSCNGRARIVEYSSSQAAIGFCPAVDEAFINQCNSLPSPSTLRVLQLGHSSPSIGDTLIDQLLTLCIDGGFQCLDADFLGCSTFQNWRQLNERVEKIREQCPNISVEIRGHQTVQMLRYRSAAGLWPFACANFYEDQSENAPLTLIVRPLEQAAATYPLCSDLGRCIGDCEEVRCAEPIPGTDQFQIVTRVCSCPGELREDRYCMYRDGTFVPESARPRRCLGACCNESTKSCFDGVPAGECPERDGQVTSFKKGETCSEACAPCCASGACSVVTRVQCEAWGGKHDSSVRSCSQTNCFGGACCVLPSGDTPLSEARCRTQSKEKCETYPGRYLWVDSNTCSTVNCADEFAAATTPTATPSPSPTGEQGACCLSDPAGTPEPAPGMRASGSASPDEKPACQDWSREQCEETGGEFRSGLTCNVAACPGDQPAPTATPSLTPTPGVTPTVAPTATRDPRQEEQPAPKTGVCCARNLNQDGSIDSQRSYCGESTEQECRDFPNSSYFDDDPGNPFNCDQDCYQLGSCCRETLLQDGSVVRDCQDGTTREQCDAMEVGPVTTRFNGGPCAQADCVPRDCSQYQSSSCSLANLDAECLCNGVSPGSWWICVPDDGTPIRCGPL